MHDFALGLWSGVFGASGFEATVAPRITSASAMPPSPVKLPYRKFRLARSKLMRLLQVKKLVEVEQHDAQAGERFRWRLSGIERLVLALLCYGGPPRQRGEKCNVELLIDIRTCQLDHPLGEAPRCVMREVAVQ